MKIITKSNIVMFILFFAMYCLGFAMCTITITRELEGQNSIMNEQIATLTDAVEAKDASLTDLNKQLDTLSEEKTQLEEKITELQENLDELEKENLDFEKAYYSFPCEYCKDETKKKPFPFLEYHFYLYTSSLLDWSSS